MKGGGFNRALSIAAAVLGGVVASVKGIGNFFAQAYTAHDRWQTRQGKPRIGARKKPNPKGFAAIDSKRLRHRREAPSFRHPHTLVARSTTAGAAREQHLRDESSPYPKKVTAQAIYGRAGVQP